MTKSESKQVERGRSMMRSQEICWKGQVEAERMGVRGGTVGCVGFALLTDRASLNILPHEGHKTGLPEFGGNQLTGF